MNNYIAFFGSTLSSLTLKFFLFGQVQPDMDELTENVEDIAEEGEKKEEIKLGRLQYKVSCVQVIVNRNYSVTYVFPPDVMMKLLFNRWSTISTLIAYQ